MKIFLFLFLFFVGARVFSQDTLTYKQMICAEISADPELTTWQYIKSDPVFVPAIVLVGTFAVNQAIVVYMEGQGRIDDVALPTLLVASFGITVSLSIFFRGLDKHK